MAEFEIFRKMDWNAMIHDYDVDGSQLLPWDRYPMPFGGAWCVVRPHTRSKPHTQIDQELFFAVKGAAKLVVGVQEFEFNFGDIAAIPKHTDHYVVNDSDDDFHFYVVWWDENHANRFFREIQSESKV
jgi:oxalate decarboxylase/phosphoglucose isomerase-like protein (cupin superfamily)